MSFPTPVTFLLLAAGWCTLQFAAAAVYQFQAGSTITGSPDLTVPSGSATICALRCVGLAFCTGFSRAADGSCRLYLQPSFDGSGDGDPGQRSYRLRVPAKCPPGFHPCAGTGRCLARISDKTDFAGARAACATAGARLTVPRREADNNCLNTWTDGGIFLWLGVSDEDGDGVFLGVDGLGKAPNDDGWWGMGEPSRSSTNPEPYVFFSRGGWADVPAGYDAHPMCEADGQY